MPPILRSFIGDDNANASASYDTTVVPFGLALVAGMNTSSATAPTSAFQSQSNSSPGSATSPSATESSPTPSASSAFAFPSPSGVGPGPSAGSSSLSQTLFIPFASQDPSSSQAQSSIQSDNTQQPSLPSSSSPSAATSSVSNGNGETFETASIPAISVSPQSGISSSALGSVSPGIGLDASATGVAGPGSSGVSTTAPLSTLDASPTGSLLPNVSRRPSSINDVAIAGGVVGGVLLACVIVAVWAFLRRRRKLRSEKDRLQMSVVSRRASMLSQATSLTWLHRSRTISVYDQGSDPHVADPFRDEMTVVDPNENMYRGGGDENPFHSYGIPLSLVPGGVDRA